MKIVIVGAGIYGSTIAISLAKLGHDIDIYDPIGIMRAASSINQYRVHRGYHYPRSDETISEVLEARGGFIEEYSEAIISSSAHYYAIPINGSLTSVEEFEKKCDTHKLPLSRATPTWMDFSFIDKCYKVDESIYDHVILRNNIIKKFKKYRVNFIQSLYVEQYDDDYEKVIYATYGDPSSNGAFFDNIETQVVEKIMIKLPNDLNKKSLVVIDGPFTAFDPYGTTGYALFGSAKYTNHWCSSYPGEDIPFHYKGLLNTLDFFNYNETKFNLMINDAANTVPLIRGARYCGSKFTRRFVERNPCKDRRIMHIKQTDKKHIHVFSGKVVSAVKASILIGNLIGE